MELVIVGSGTVEPVAERACSGYFVVAGSRRIIFDCGPGIVHHLARFELPWRRIDHVVLSHFHNDHTGDLPMLLFALKHAGRGRRDPLTILAPRGFQTRLAGMREAFGEHVSNPGFPLRVIEAGEEHDLGEGVLLRSAPARHTKEARSFRLESGGASLGYSGDTGPLPALGAFFSGVDVLLVECSLPDEQAMDMHLTPSGVAELAREAAPGKVLLTHIYPHLAREDVAGLVRAAGWDGAVEQVADGGRYLVVASGASSASR